MQGWGLRKPAGVSSEIDACHGTPTARDRWVEPGGLRDFLRAGGSRSVGDPRATVSARDVSSSAATVHPYGGEGLAKKSVADLGYEALELATR